MTRAGLRTGSRGRVVKDDRRSRSWIGLDNSSRVAELADEIASLERDLTVARAAWDTAEAESSARRRVLDAVARSTEFSWADIDTAPAQARLDDLQGQLDRLADERPELATLQADARRHDEERSAATRRLAEFDHELARLEAEHSTLVDIEDAFSDALTGADPLTDHERALLAPLPFAAPREVADVERSHREALSLLRGQIDGHDRERTQAENTLVLIFERYLELDRTAGIDA